MQIAISLHRTGPAPHWTAPRFVQRICTRGRGAIITSPSATVADPAASLDALDVMLAELVAVSLDVDGYRLTAGNFCRVVKA